MVAPVCNSTLGRLKQEDGELKVILRHNKILLQRKRQNRENNELYSSIFHAHWIHTLCVQCEIA